MKTPSLGARRSTDRPHGGASVFKSPTLPEVVGPVELGTRVRAGPNGYVTVKVHTSVTTRFVLPFPKGAVKVTWYVPAADFFFIDDASAQGDR